MVSTPGLFTNNSPMSPSQSMTVKHSSAIKFLLQFSEALDVKHKTAVRWFGASKSKHETIRVGKTFW